MSIDFKRTLRKAAKILSEEQLKGLLLLAVSTDCANCKSRNQSGCYGCTIMHSMSVINKTDFSKCI